MNMHLPHSNTQFVVSDARILGASEVNLWKSTVRC